MEGRHVAVGALALSSFSLIASCGEEASQPLAGTYVLEEGVEVEVSGDGGVEISVDGRGLFALAPGQAPTLHRFSRSATGPFGIWEFSRRNTSKVKLDQLVRVERADGELALHLESEDGSASGTLRLSTVEGNAATRLTLEGSWDEGQLAAIGLPVRCDESGSFHGFGEQYHEADQRGEAFELFVSEQGIGRRPDAGKLPFNGDRHTTYFPMPWYLDQRGFGVLVRTEARVVADVCAQDPGVARLEVESGAPLDVLVFHGPGPLDVIEQLGAEVGRPASPPDWAYSPWIAAQGGRDVVLAELAALQDAQIPFSALWVQDWTGIRMNVDGGFGVQYRWRPDEELYPDLAGLIDELHAQGVRFLGYANPFIDPELEHFPELESAGLLIHDPDGEPYVHNAPNIFSSHADLSDPAARAYVRGELQNMVDIYGMDGWMADFGEWLPLDAVYADGRDPMEGHNRYPIDWHTVTREALDAARPDGDWVVIARSGWTGVHAVSQIHWIGDQEADFSPHDGLPTVVPAMLTLGLSGVPYVTHDIAGFSGGPSTKELWQRWTELGAFTPFMRTHEGNKKLENWSWEKDLETTEHFRRFARIHEALAPEFRELAELSATTSAPIVRHLGLVFPEDADSWSVSDQFMIGESLLVAPVVDEGATSREVYLPPGETWFHVWTGDSFEGGDYVSVDAPIGSPPVFSRGEDRADLRAIE